CRPVPVSRPVPPEASMPAPIRSLLAALPIVVALLAPAAPATAGIEFTKERYLLDGSTPSVCLDFSAPVAFPAGSFPEDYLAMTPAAPVDVRVQDGALCIGGLAWGTAYEATVRPGVPAEDGSRTAAARIVALNIPDA